MQDGDEFDEFGDFKESAQTALHEADILPPKKANKMTIRPAPAPDAQTPADDKKVSKSKKTAREKAMAKMLKLGHVDAFPPIETLFEEHVSDTFLPIKDIAIFLNDDTGDEILNDLAKQLSVRNTINASAEVNLRQMIAVGGMVLEAGKVWMAIEVARIKDGDTTRLECWSGRHRLAFIAFAYGSDGEIPVRISNKTQAQARDAVIYANRCRRVRAMEKAEHAALCVTSGVDITSVDRDELYEGMCTTKARAKQFAAISVMALTPKGMKLNFGVSTLSSRAEGDLTTVEGLKGYLGAAVQWKKKMSRAEFDCQLRAAVEFINAVVEELKAKDGFDPSQQMASKPLVAVGLTYLKLLDAVRDGSTPVDCAEYVADGLISLGQIGRQRSEDTLERLRAYVVEASK